MKKEFLIGLGLTDEQANKIIDTVKEEMEGFLPKSRFDEVNNAKKDLETKIEDLKKTVEESAKFKNDFENLKAESEKRMNELNEMLTKAQLQRLMESALHGAKARDIKSVLAHIDTSKLKVEGETVEGLEEQVKALKESEKTSFLFHSDKPNAGVSGVTPTDGGSASRSGAPAPKTLREALENKYNAQF